MMTGEQDAFDAIVAELDDLAALDPESNDLSKLSKIELLQEIHKVRETLDQHEARIFPKTEDDKDLQGYYFGLVGEMRKRGLL